jgi:transposase
MSRQIINIPQIISQILKPKRATLTVEDLIKEQKYKGFDRVGFDKLVAELAVVEHIEEPLTFLRHELLPYRHQNKTEKSKM